MFTSSARVADRLRLVVDAALVGEHRVAVPRRPRRALPRRARSSRELRFELGAFGQRVAPVAELVEGGVVLLHEQERFELVGRSSVMVSVPSSVGWRAVGGGAVGGDVGGTVTGGGGGANGEVVVGTRWRVVGTVTGAAGSVGGR